MKKRVLSILFALTLVLSLAVPAAAAPSGTGGEAAAQKLYGLGLFYGAGTNADGSPNFDLDRTPTRQEGITMLVRLLGKEAEARQGSWTTPFTDVADWAKPYVGYAYANGLTNGVSATTFGGSSPVSAAQYITLVLRAMGYQDPVDFQWQTPWTLSNQLGFTAVSGSESFTRGNAVEMSYDAMMCVGKDGKTLGQTLMDAGVFTKEAAVEAGLVIGAVTLSQRTLTLEEGESAALTAKVSDGGSVIWRSSDPSVAGVRDGRVTAVKAGATTITATVGEDSAQCLVTVTPKFTLSISQSALTLKATKTARLTASASDGSAVTWSSSAPSVASVGASGDVSAHKVGTATITAAAANGKTVTCAVTVTENTPFDVPLMNHEYGPMTTENIYGTKSELNQITSLVFTKAEPSYGGKYQLFLSIQGVSNDEYYADIYVYFYDANNRVLEKVGFSPRITQNTPYNELVSRHIDGDVLENAVRIGFFSASGKEAVEGIHGSSVGSGSSGGNSGSGNDSGSGGDSGSGSSSGVTIDRNAVYASYPDVPDFGKVFGVEALEEDTSGAGTFYTYSVRAAAGGTTAGKVNEVLETYTSLLRAHGFRYDSTQKGGGFTYDAYSKGGIGYTEIVVSVGVFYSGSTPSRFGINVIPVD